MVEKVDLDPIVTGDTETWAFTFDVDITGWTLWMTVKESKSVSDANAAIQKKVTTHDDPTNGKTTVTLESSDTEGLDPQRYYYDFQTKDSAGDIETVMMGELPVLEDVTNSTS